MGTTVKNSRYYGETRIQAEEKLSNYAQELSKEGYKFVSSQWVPEKRSMWLYFFSILLIGVYGLGLVVILYLLFTPSTSGWLHVTYQLEQLEGIPKEQKAIAQEGKICPQCAETVKQAAKICRFCRYSFEP